MPTLPWSSGAATFAATLFGGRCYLCRGTSGRAVLCAACAADLPQLPVARCPRCALPAADGLTCGRCLANPPAFDATVAAFAYAFPANVLVQGLKFRGELALAPLLGAALAREIAAAGDAAPHADLILPVPLHPTRLVQRGYNQSMEIARTLANALGLPVDTDACARLRDTPAQVELPWKARVGNVRGAFSCRRSLDATVVAVVDDVMTTGATLGELAATLKQFGARRVVNWVVTRTLPD